MSIAGPVEILRWWDLVIVDSKGKVLHETLVPGMNGEHTTMVALLPKGLQSLSHNGLS